MKLIATKSLRYDTRRLQAGDEFDATNMHARILVGARKARYAPAQIVEPPPQPVAVTEPDEPVVAPSDLGDVDPRNIDSLRAEAERLGIEVDRRWGRMRLQHEIAQRR